MMRSLAFIVLLLLSPWSRVLADQFQEGRAGFSVKVRGVVCPYEVFGLYAAPKETLELQLVGSPPGTFRLEAAGGNVLAREARRWSWRAPAKAGLYPLWLTRDGTGEEMLLNVFVIVPISRVKDGRLNGYRIGKYPSTPLRGLTIYKPPRGFVEVNPGMESVKVSPHFTLGQFLCKQAGGPPRYLILREKLLLLLEFLLKEVNLAGIRTDGFNVMSGFRTPYYNDSIGNVKYSRHQWGGAADIFIDVNPRDGVMDDLDGDGRIDKGDSDWLYDLVEGLRSEEANSDYEGGTGGYGSTPAHGPFVHVDARGFRARWGR